MRGQNGQDFESPVQENLSSRDFRIISDSIRYDQILKITRILLGIIIQELQKVTVYIRFLDFGYGISIKVRGVELKVFKGTVAIFLFLQF